MTLPRQTLLLVDADPRSARVLEVSLRKAGYDVTAYADAQEAFSHIEEAAPDLILADTRLPGIDGFAFLKKLRENAKFSAIPFVFLSSDQGVESKVRGLELGVEEYLTKPIYIKELLTRVQLVLSRKQREGLQSERASTGSRTKFTGSLADMGLVDLLTTIDLSRKSGILHLGHGGIEGAIYFRDGKIIDAVLGGRKGEAAIYRALVWSEGAFEIDFRAVRRDDRIATSTQGILMEGMRRLDEWSRLAEALPPLGSRCEVSADRLRAMLAEIPDDANAVLKQIDGERSLLGVVDAVEADDLATLHTLKRLVRDGIVLVAEPLRPAGEGTADGAVRHDSTRPMKTLVPPPPVLDAHPDRAEMHGKTRKTLPDFSGESGNPQEPGADTPPLGFLSLGMALAESAEASAASLSENQTGSTLPPPVFLDETAEDPSATHGKEDEEAMSKKSKRPKKATQHAQAHISIPPPAAVPQEKENNVIHFPNGGKPKVADTLTKFPPSDPQDFDRPTIPTEPLEERFEAEPKESKKPSTKPRSDAKHPQKSETKPKKSLDTTDEHAAVHDEFFDSDPHAGAHLDTWDDLHTGTHAAVQQAKKRSMRVALTVGAVGVAVLGAFIFYFEFIAPQPAELGGGPAVVTLPTAPPVTDSIAPERAPEPVAAIEAPSTGETPPEPALIPEAPVVTDETAATPAEPAIAQAPTEVVPEPELTPPPAPIAAEPPPAPVQEAPPPAPVATASTPDYDAALAAAKRARGRAVIPAWEAALAINPSGTAALSGIAYAHLNLRHNQEAATFAGQAVASDPTNAQGWLVLGAARAELRDNPGAREAFRACVAQGRGREVRDCRAMLTIY